MTNLHDLNEKQVHKNTRLPNTDHIVLKYFLTSGATLFNIIEFPESLSSIRINESRKSVPNKLNPVNLSKSLV